LEAYLQAEIWKALFAGEWLKFTSYILIFVGIWQNVRQAKKELAKLNENFVKSLTTNEAKFKDGEQRFEKIEKTQLDFEHRLTVVEKTKPMEGI